MLQTRSPYRVTGPSRGPVPRMVVGAVAAATLLSACTAGTGGRGAAVPPSTGAPAVPTTSPAASTGASAAAFDPVVQVVRLVEPAVVNVTATSRITQPFLGTSTQRAVGSGFIVSASGAIVTNDHVIENATAVRVTLPDGRAFAARVVRADSARDLALLQVDATGLPTVSLGHSSSLQLGQAVVAIGYALGLSGGPTVTSGIISSLERTVQAQDANAAGGSRTYRNMLQTSAAINPGNSGGPLVDLNGNVVGIDTAGVDSADNIGFAISVDAARSFIGTALNGSTPATS